MSYTQTKEAVESEINLDEIINEAVSNANSMNNAQTLAREAAENAVEEAASDAPDPILAELKDDYGWLALREAGTDYMNKNVEEFNL